MDNQTALQGKRILVIGGTTGIGLSAGNAFVAQGAKVVATGLSRTREDGKHWKFLNADAIAENSAEIAVNHCVQVFGGLDALFHVVGGSGRQWGDVPLHELSLDGWQKTLTLNLTSVMLSNRAAIRYFLEQQQPGCILNTSSVLAYSFAPKFFYTHAYSTAKAAIIGLSKASAAFYAPENIRINVLAPALTDTPMAQRAAANTEIQHYIKSKQPLDGGRMAQPDDLEGAVVFLLSDAARFITGQVIAVDGGWEVSEGQY